MLFSIYYSMDLTRGFLNIALSLMGASIQDLQRLPEILHDTPIFQELAEPIPFDHTVVHPFIASLDDGASAIYCSVGTKVCVYRHICIYCICMYGCFYVGIVRKDVHMLGNKLCWYHH